MAIDESGSPWPRSRLDAEVEDIIATLERYGVLTRSRLVHLCGAGHWSEPAFARALALAVSSGKVRPLGDELYEPTDP